LKVFLADSLQIGNYGIDLIVKQFHCFIIISYSNLLVEQVIYRGFDLIPEYNLQIVVIMCLEAGLSCTIIAA
jgi:hypothetical protein